MKNRASVFSRVSSLPTPMAKEHQYSHPPPPPPPPEMLDTGTNKHVPIAPIQMTGLNPSTDTIMSISCILTTSELLPLDATGFDAVIHHTASQLSAMSDWCVRTHGASGLTQSCLASTTTSHAAAHALLSYIKHFIPEPRRALLAGNSIHADRGFLAVAPWDAVLEHLHYRLFDVSAVKEMVRRWAGDDVLSGAPTKMLRHTAKDDVWESLDEARYYKRLVEGMVFVPVPAGPGGRDVAMPVAGGGMSAGPGTGNGTAIATASASTPGFVSGVGIVGAKRDQAQSTGRRNNDVQNGPVDELAEGFRTDVP